MRITVKLVGPLVDRLPAHHPLGPNPRSAAPLDLADDADVATLLETLGLSPELEYFAMINEDHVPAAELAARRLQADDAVVLFPPLKGG
ncbi:MAG: MoaD/ThiS family protein [Gammaproteobacteria bacterium]